MRERLDSKLSFRERLDHRLERVFDHICYWDVRSKKMPPLAKEVVVLWVGILLIVSFFPALLSQWLLEIEESGK